MTLPEAITPNNNPNQRKHDSFDWVTLVVGIITLIAVGIYTVVQICQTILIRENNEALQRAYVFLKDVRLERKNDDVFDIVPEWENTGNSETVNMTAHINRLMNITPLPEGFNFGDIGTGTEVPIVLGPKTESGISFTAIRRSCLEKFNHRDGVSNFYVWGWAQYWDVFRRPTPHRTRFCWDINDIVFGEGNNVRRISYGLCKQGNCAENDCPQPGPMMIQVPEVQCDPPSPKPSHAG